MKRITVEAEGCAIVDISVGGRYEDFILHFATKEAIDQLGGEAVVIPSRHGAMSLRFDGKNYYDVYDGDSSTGENLCQIGVEDAIGKGFRKKHFTFYLREV